MKIFVKITLFITAPALLLFFIFYKADLPNRLDNGFIRSFLPAPKLVSDLYLPPIVQGIIGKKDKEILLSTAQSDKLITFLAGSGTYRTAPITSSHSLQETLASITTFSMHMDGQHIYLYNYHDPTVFAIQANSKKLESTLKIGFFCSTVAPLRPDAAIVRGYASTRSSLLFGKITVPSDTVWETNISLPSLDGGLSTDGQLLYDHESSLLTYMHYYNNHITVFDTLLHLKHRFNTLDTIAPKYLLDPAKPRLITNKIASLHNGILYVCSNLRADNETYQEYMKNIPVDRYNIRTGTYLGSFYLPVDKGKLIRDLKAVDGHLYAYYFSGRFSVFSLPDTSS